MYVDDSGNPNIEDETQYYVISGVIINTCDLFHIEIELENFRRKYFVSDFKNEEIHVHEIYKGKGKFVNLFKKQKYNILNGLYCTIEHLPIITISVGIHKENMSRLYPHWNLFNTAWTFLAERFDMFLCGESLEQVGQIIIDESDNTQIDETTKILQNLIKYGTKYGIIEDL